MLITQTDLDNRFDYHKPDRATTKRHEEVRVVLKQLALIVNRLPEGRESALAMTKLEECGFWCQAAIARAVEDD